jgi:2-haloalkanoic acid dehalogenase type II
MPWAIGTHSWSELVTIASTHWPPEQGNLCTRREEVSVPAVAFDYYETLAEITTAMRFAVFDRFASELGLSVVAGELGKRWTKLSAGYRPGPFNGPIPSFETFRSRWEARAEELLGEFGVSGAGSLLARRYADLHAEAKLYPDAGPLIERLREQFRVGILSDADTDFLSASLGRSGLGVDAVLSSQELETYKPHATAFQSICGRLDAAPDEVVFVGDDPVTDIEGARRAGLRTVWVNRHRRAWPRKLAPPETEVATLQDVDALVLAILA